MHCFIKCINKSMLCSLLHGSYSKKHPKMRLQFGRFDIIYIYSTWQIPLFLNFNDSKKNLKKKHDSILSLQAYQRSLSKKKALLKNNGNEVTGSVRITGRKMRQAIIFNTTVLCCNRNIPATNSSNFISRKHKQHHRYINNSRSR